MSGSESPWRTILTAFGLSLLTTAVCLAVYFYFIADYPPAFFPEDHTAAIAAAAKKHGLPEALALVCPPEQDTANSSAP